MEKTQHFYFFGAGQTEGRGDMKATLGGKGAGLAEMTVLGIPVPPGFTITTGVCAHYDAHHGGYPEGFDAELRRYMGRLEAAMNMGFGDPLNPLLVSVRSGAPVSMPGMMDTILNLGLNEATVVGVIAQSRDARFAYDSYRRFIQMYSDVVLGVERGRFEHLIEHRKAELGVELDTELRAEDWQSLVAQFKALVLSATGQPFPESPWDQLWGAIGAVFQSWNNKRAIDYRKIHNISADLGTAVNIQSMVFGNMGEDCATGVAFTRDPNTGEPRFFGEYLINAQGEDVVAGIRTPYHVRKKDELDANALEARMPEAYADLERTYKLLEQHYKDMQDIEFTIQRGRLWMLQTRTGKRTAQAAVRIAVDMVAEGLIDWKTALKRVKPEQVEQLLHPTLDTSSAYQVLAKGLPASPGAVSGKVVFDPEEATQRGERGEKVILVRPETSPEDVMGMKMSVGILTCVGGMTSHAAVVGRGMGKCCIVGCHAVQIDLKAGIFRVGDTVVKHLDIITLNGTSGEVILGELKTRRGRADDPSLKALLEQADKLARLGVRANADNPEDSKVAREFGAVGIGLCRTEHMFFDKERIQSVRQMILADEDVQARRTALEQLLPYQTQDFMGIFKAMAGYPVTIRLLDPPLHEFLPTHEKEMEPVAAELGVSVATLAARVEKLKELNPMLGHRGCRLGVTNPEIYDMQVQAILRAAAILYKREGLEIAPEIMIPLVGDLKELTFFRTRIEKLAAEIQDELGVDLRYTIGTMIELPRAALIADEIAQAADFFSFGTNDLTQTTYGLSRDDMARFAFAYHDLNIWPVDPFKTLDAKGVGKLVKMGVELGRSARAGLKVGICGEHGGDPASIHFCHQVGLDYVSCSPYRVPVARLAAAQAVLGV